MHRLHHLILISSCEVDNSIIMNSQQMRKLKAERLSNLLTISWLDGNGRQNSNLDKVAPGCFLTNYTIPSPLEIKSHFSVYLS